MSPTPYPFRQALWIESLSLPFPPTLGPRGSRLASLLTWVMNGLLAGLPASAHSQHTGQRDHQLSHQISSRLGSNPQGSHCLVRCQIPDATSRCLATLHLAHPALATLAHRCAQIAQAPVSGPLHLLHPLLWPPQKAFPEPPLKIEPFLLSLRAGTNAGPITDSPFSMPQVECHPVRARVLSALSVRSASTWNRAWHCGSSMHVVRMSKRKRR